MAVFANDGELLRRLLTASDDAGEPMWHLPLWEKAHLRQHLDSEVADLGNLCRAASRAPR